MVINFVFLLLCLKNYYTYEIHKSNNFRHFQLKCEEKIQIIFFRRFLSTFFKTITVIRLRLQLTNYFMQYLTGIVIFSMEIFKFYYNSCIFKGFIVNYKLIGRFFYSK